MLITRIPILIYYKVRWSIWQNQIPNIKLCWCGTPPFSYSLRLKIQIKILS